MTTRLTQAILPTIDERWTFDYATAIEFTKTTLATLGDDNSEQAPYDDFVKSLYETNPEPFDEVCKRQVAHFEQLMKSAISSSKTRLLRKILASLRVYLSFTLGNIVGGVIGIYWLDGFAGPTTKAIEAATFIQLISIPVLISAPISHYKSERRELADRLVTMRKEVQEDAASEIKAIANLKIAEASKHVGRIPVSAKSLHLVDFVEQGIVETDTIKNITHFVEAHRTASVGIAGRRGSGKTTAIRYLTKSFTQKGWTVLTIPLPVRYEPLQIIATTYREFIKSALTHIPSNHSKGLTRTRILLLLMWATYFFGFTSFIPPSAIEVQINALGVQNQIPFFFSLAFGVATLLWIFFSQLAKRRQSRSKRRKDINQTLAFRSALLRAEEMLQFTSERETGSGLKFSPVFAQMLQFEGSTKRRLTERPWDTLSALVSFRESITRYLELGLTEGLLICLDELDKLEGPESVKLLLGDLKDLMHIPNCHFIVSVSDDALAEFSLRGIDARTVFDSSLDTIFELHPLTLAESELVLLGRTSGFPLPLVSLCHMLSCGNSRDLLRNARACVSAIGEMQASRNKPDDNPKLFSSDEKELDTIKTIARTVIYKELQSVLRSSFSRAAGSWPACHQTLKNVLIHSTASDQQLFTVLDELKSNPEFNEVLGLDLNAYAAFLHSTFTTYCKSQTYSAWLKEVDSAEFRANVKFLVLHEQLRRKFL
ncbi:P-loop NTPase fold protein [Buchananella felis]|uniref:P-loop NTPase fold protein n=1 Tax=Buchananella felis TaxID=3231492 RepID=UPI003526FB31